MKEKHKLKLEKLRNQVIELEEKKDKISEMNPNRNLSEHDR